MAPGTSELYFANADGSNERKLLGNESHFDCQATFSTYGQWATFTTERNGDGDPVGSDSYVHECSRLICGWISIESGQTGMA